MTNDQEKTSDPHTLSNENMDRWKESIYPQIGPRLNLFTRYGFGAIALLAAAFLHSLDASSLKVTITLVAIAFAHIMFRHWFMINLELPVNFKEIKIERDKHMQDIEQDPQLKAMGIYVDPEEWPKIMDMVLRRSVLKAYENLSSKCISVLGYICMFLTLVHNTYA